MCAEGYIDRAMKDRDVAKIQNRDPTKLPDGLLRSAIKLYAGVLRRRKIASDERAKPKASAKASAEAGLMCFIGGSFSPRM